jgi:hypothetical protein
MSHVDMSLRRDWRLSIMVLPSLMDVGVDVFLVMEEADVAIAIAPMLAERDPTSGRDKSDVPHRNATAGEEPMELVYDVTSTDPTAEEAATAAVVVVMCLPLCVKCDDDRGQKNQRLEFDPLESKEDVILSMFNGCVVALR